MSQEKVVVSAKYEFTEGEKDDMGRELAKANVSKDHIENEKKLAMDKFKDRLKPVVANIQKLSTNIEDGYEWRDFECRIEYDYDARMVNYRELKTEKIVKQEPMKGDDLQRHFA